MKTLVCVILGVCIILSGCSTSEPSISILQPADGATVTGTFDIRVEASGGDVVHTYIDSEWCSTGNPDSGLSCNSTVFSNGSHQLRVDLATLSENSLASDTIMIRIGN